MKKGMRFLCIVIVLTLIPITSFATTAVEIKAPMAVLMEASTGEVLFEQAPDEKAPIASVTKVMTLLLIMEAIDSGKITMNEMVTASPYACTMGGSQIWLKPGEQMSVSDMLKAICVASANDCCVAMAEHILGSNEAFIAAMNERAKALGMNNTNFINCNGLDADNHYSCARDVAIMSKELLKHDKIKPFLTIWMDTLRDGKFGLSNTNKLIRFYQGAIGIKTGSTGKAKYCLSSAAVRNDMTLIGVVLGAPSTADRFASASKLLDYGFANYSVVKGIESGEFIDTLAVAKGSEIGIDVVALNSFSKLMSKDKQAKIEKQIILPQIVNAPIKQNDKVGEMIFSSNGEELGRVDLVAQNDVDKIKVGAVLISLIKLWAQV